jgi:hypothetical protein
VDSRKNAKAFVKKTQKFLVSCIYSFDSKHYFFAVVMLPSWLKLSATDIWGSYHELEKKNDHSCTGIYVQIPTRQEIIESEIQRRAIYAEQFDTIVEHFCINPSQLDERFLNPNRIEYRRR